MTIPVSVYKRAREAYHEHRRSAPDRCVTAYIAEEAIDAWEKHKASGGRMTIIMCGCSRCEMRGSYFTSACCWNCGWEGEAEHTLGHGVTRNATCPGCECRTVRMGEFLRSNSCPEDTEDTHG